MSDHSQSFDNESPPGRWAEIFRGRLGAYNFMINLGTILFGIDSFVVITIMPTVVEDIGGLDLYAWPFALFHVGAIIGAASARPVRDALGWRNAYAGAGVLFMIGILGASFAPNMTTLVGFRLIEGIGGGALLSQSYGLVAAFFPENLRGRVLAVVSTTWGVATLMGPAFGGVIAEFQVWRPAFWGMVPLALVFIGLAWRYVPKSEAPGHLGEIPYIRLALFALAVLCVSATSQLQSDSLRIALIVLSTIIAAIAFRRDAKAKITLLPRTAMVYGTEIGVIYWVFLLMSVILVFVNVYSTLYLQVLHQQSPLVAGYIFAMLSFFWTGGALAAAPFRGRSMNGSVLFGLLLVLGGSVGLAAFVVSGPIWAIAVSLAVIGTGVGFCNNPMIQLAILAVPDDEKSLAGSSTQTVRTLGFSFGAAGAGFIAASAGLTTEADPEIVARAMNWVYRANVGVAVLTLLAAIPMLARSRARAAPAE